MWLISSILLLIWFILKVLLHKGGYSHILLVVSLSLIGVKLLAERKTRYHRNANRTVT